MFIRHIITSVIICFCLTHFAIADEVKNVGKDIDYPYSDDDFSPCGVAKSDDERAAASQQKSAETDAISYVTGGICAEEVNFMKGIAQHFPLETVFVQADNGKEVYLADVNVSLQNAQQEEVLNVVTDGPFLFVNLPDGKYTIVASYHGIEQKKPVNITQKKHSRIVFLWPEKTEMQM